MMMDSTAAKVIFVVLDSHLYGERSFNLGGETTPNVSTSLPV